MNHLSQTELVESYQKLDEMSEIIASSNMGIWRIFLLNGKAPTMEADDRMRELLGIGDKAMTPEEVYAVWFSNIVPSAVQSVLDSVENMKAGGRDENTYLWRHPVLGERYVRCGGTAKPVDGGYVLRGYHYDVDADVRAEKEKDEALKAQLAIINALSRSFRNVFVANLNDATARVIRLEDSYKVKAIRDAGIRTFPFDAVVDRWIRETVHPDDQKRMKETINIQNIRKIFSKQDEYVGTYRNIEDGVQHHYQYDFRKVDDEGNVVVGFRLIDSIVEEQLAQEKRLSQALAAAQQASRAKSTFLNSMSHDIRTPMNAIIGFTALAQKHLEDPALMQDYLEKISTSSKHLLSLINDILDMSRIESGTVKLEEKPVHLPELLRDLRTMIQGLANAKSQNLHIEARDVLHENVIADKLRLNQVLINIAGNAIKFTRFGGDISVRLIEKTCRMKHYACFEFSVKDNGIGMSQEFLGHIFDTFSREYSSTVSGIQGTGLGMAITKNIVDMMGGEISVQSEEGKGSLFTVTLNLRIADEPVQNEGVPELPGRIPPKKEKKRYDYSGRRALLVEDNELNREIATAILEETGMTIDSVNDGDEAVAAINAAPADRYDVILMDIQMPKMDGYTATREIRTLLDNRKANIPIVAMTANAFEEDKQKAFASGMNGHIIKPVSMEQIAAVLDTVFAEKEI